VTRAPSTLLGGRYSLVDRLAVGGMGEVWCADDTVLGRAVAIKVLRDEYADDPTFRQRFRAEAQHAAMLVHPNVAQVFDFDEGDEEAGLPPYLVMELIRGEPLSDVIAREAPLAPDRVWRILGQAASALSAAHAAGVVHRDVKPANLLICPDGAVKVTDFGIARAANTSSVTATGLMLGTPHYLSPEQVSGQQATPASDFYALGVVAYECLTGRRPFDGEAVAVLLAHRDSPAPPVPPDVPASLRDLVTALLAKDPAARPTDGRDIAAQAQRLSGAAPATPMTPTAAPARPEPYPAEPSPSTSVLAVPPAAAVLPADGAADRARERPGRRSLPGWLIAAGLAALCLVAIVVIVLTYSSSSAPAAKAKTPPKATPLTTVKAASVAPYSTSGSSADHPEEAPLAIDGDPSTSWFTQHYATSSFGGLRTGAGLVFDLGRAVDVRRLTLRLSVPGTAVTVHAGNSESGLLQAKTVASASQAGSTLVVRSGATARYWLVWFTRLAPSDGAFRAGVAEAVFAR
jgi:serine/threonine-protein kinase